MRLSSFLKTCVLMVVPLLLPHTAVAQQPTVTTSPAATPSPPSTSGSDRYHIGPGDVLDIRVSVPMPNAPLLSRDAVRVEGNGMIRMPRIEGDIQAACKTEGELALEISARYQKYYRHPSVDVFVKEFNSSQVAVIGAVNTPSRFQLQRRVRLLELLVLANGPAERAGQVVNIVRALGPRLCQTPAADQPGQRQDDLATGIVSYRLKDTLLGDDQANPYLRPGDIVSIPEANHIYVVGNVLSPRAIPLREPVTVTRAIAMAGGVQQDTKRDRIRIVRQPPGSATKIEIYVDLKAIDKKQAEDIVLQPNDIVDVPTSPGKVALRSLVGAMTTTVAQLPIVLVP